MTKRFLGILVLGLLWCNTAFALTQQSAIDQFLSDRKLSKVEGIWIADGGRIIVIYKAGSTFDSKVIKSADEASGSVQFGPITKGSENVYYGSVSCGYIDTSGWSNKERWTTCNSKYVISGNQFRNTITYPAAINVRPGSSSHTWSRIWPENFSNHNAKFEKEKKKKKKDKLEASSGTAFFVTQKGHLVTNFHVVETCNDKSQIIYKDKNYKVKLLAKDKNLDLALLKADIENKVFINISNKSPKKLQRIIAAGYQFGKKVSDDLKFTSGIVSSLKGIEDDSTRIQIDAALNYGNSGGPIVDENSGELVAVAVAGLRKDMTESINFGIKAGSVKNFLDSNQIDPALLVKKYSWGFTDVSSILENATVYTFCE